MNECNAKPFCSLLDHFCRNSSFAWFLLFLLVALSNPNTIKCQALALLASNAKSPSPSSSVAAEVLESKERDRQIVTDQLGYLPLNFLAVSARNAQGLPIAIQTYPIQPPQQHVQQKSHHKNDIFDFSLLKLDVSAPPGTWGTPFPTQYWLTCPDIARAIGDLERMSYTRIIADYLNLESNIDLRDQLLYCHQQSGIDRWKTLHPSHRAFFEQYRTDSSTVAKMQFYVRESGIAGLNYQEQLSSDGTRLEEVAIKCLHTHYAHFCSTSPDRREVDGASSSVASSSSAGGSSSHSSSSTAQNPIGRITHDLLRTNFPSLCL